MVYLWFSVGVWLIWFLGSVVTNDDGFDRQFMLNRARGLILYWRKKHLIEFDGTSYDELRRLFAVESIDAVSVEQLRSLLGVHGLTIYKMMKAKQDE